MQNEQRQHLTIRRANVCHQVSPHLCIIGIGTLILLLVVFSFDFSGIITEVEQNQSVGKDLRKKNVTSMSQHQQNARNYWNVDYLSFVEENIMAFGAILYLYQRYTNH